MLILSAGRWRGKNMRVAIVENTGNTAHGQVGVALAEAGAIIEQYRPYLGQPLPESFAGHDALVVFGGEQSARDDATHPYLPQLCALMHGAVEAGRATLGICLGSQLLARAYGAASHIGTAPEFGWVGITRLGADPVLDALPRNFTSFQWHSDTFDLPAGAVHLAQSPGAAHQAFRMGRAGYGTQFHFEAHQNVVTEWTRQFPGQIEAMAPGWIADHHARHARKAGAQADTAGLALARAFVAQI
jgi:GMP synthase-like glutamine amidotransferase